MLSHPSTTLRASALVALALAAGGAGIASAQDDPAADADATLVTVTPAPALGPGDTSPFSVPGVRAIRAGEAIPSGFRLVGRTVSTRGDGPSAGAYLRYSCPGSTRLRSFAVRGDAGFRAANADYVGRRTAYVASVRRGATGSVYAVCS